MPDFCQTDINQAYIIVAGSIFVIGFLLIIAWEKIHGA